MIAKASKYAEYSKLYGKQRWRNKAKRQMQLEPLCAMCLQQGLVIAAEVADHIIPHKGDEQQFWNGKLQSLCWRCHSGSKAFEEAHGYSKAIGADGWPLDNRHPANR